MVYCQLALNVKNNVHLFVTDYYIGDEIIERLSQIRDLRILLDTKLDFSAHIDSLIARAFANLGFLRRICSNMYDPYTLKCLYCAHVRSILEYASMIRQPYYQPCCVMHIQLLNEYVSKNETIFVKNNFLLYNFCLLHLMLI